MSRNLGSAQLRNIGSLVGGVLWDHPASGKTTIEISYIFLKIRKEDEEKIECATSSFFCRTSKPRMLLFLSSGFAAFI